MTGPEISQIITSVATLIGVIGGVWVSLHNGQKMNDVKAKVDENSAKVDVIHEATNGMKTALIAGASREGFTAGEIQGHADEKSNPTKP